MLSLFSTPDITFIRQATPPRSGTNLASNRKHFKGSLLFLLSSSTISTSGAGGGGTLSIMLSKT